jgi:ssDNA-binding Zn-finger/Zn-ribbon topoisomerase 1
MSATPRQNLGKIPCPSCGDGVALYKTATGKLSYTCQNPDCECTGYASAHTGSAKKWLAMLGKQATPTTSTPEAKQEVKPAEPKRSAFSFGSL